MGKPATPKSSINEKRGPLHQVFHILSLKYGQSGLRVCGLYPCNHEAMNLTLINDFTILYK